MGNQYFLVPEKKFDHVDDLVNYYSKNQVKNLENVSNVFLKTPIYREGADMSSGSLPRSLSGRSMNGSSNGSLSRLAQSVSFSHSSDSGSGIPSLPPRPRTQSQGNISAESSSGGQSVTGALPVNGEICNRPPMPLPTASGGKDEGPYMYSQARDVTEDISEHLKDVLKLSERCECGIPRHLAELPMGWTVHLSKDALTQGRLFYQNEEGVTSWTMPEMVTRQLTKKHIQNLQSIDKNWKVPH